MAEDVQGLMVLTEGDRFVSIGRAGRARVWRIDLTGEALEDVDRTGTAVEQREPFRVGKYLYVDGREVCARHNLAQHRDGRPPWCDDCGRMGDTRPHEEYVGGALHRPRGDLEVPRG